MCFLRVRSLGPERWIQYDALAVNLDRLEVLHDEVIALLGHEARIERDVGASGCRRQGVGHIELA